MRKWDERFMGLAALIATWSKDATKVGAVIVGPHREIRATGFNGFPRGIDDEAPGRRERPEKYFFTEHAERNALYFALKTGARVEGCTIYSTLFPCADCARGIISAGLVRLVAPLPPPPTGEPGDWRVSCAVAQAMLCEAGIVMEPGGIEPPTS